MEMLRNNWEGNTDWSVGQFGGGEFGMPQIWLLIDRLRIRGSQQRRHLSLSLLQAKDVDGNLHQRHRYCHGSGIGLGVQLRDLLSHHGSSGFILAKFYTADFALSPSRK